MLPSPLKELCDNAPPVVKVAKLFISTLTPFGGAELNVTVDPDVEYVPFSWYTPSTNTVVLSSLVIVVPVSKAVVEPSPVASCTSTVRFSPTPPPPPLLEIVWFDALVILP